MFNVRLAGCHLYGKLLFTWLSVVVYLMASFCVVLFPTRCLRCDLGRNWVSFWGISYLLFPTFYWLPKLHKIPYKARFIANSSSCTTTELIKIANLLSYSILFYPITLDNRVSFWGSSYLLNDGPNIKLVDLFKLVGTELSLVCCLVIRGSNGGFLLLR